MTCSPSKVVCLGEGLRFGYFGHPIHSTIDTRYAGPGELTVFCDGPDVKAYCELTDHHDGTFTLTIKPQEPGLHSLNVHYNGIHVPGSPFPLRVSPASLVSLSGPGIASTILDIRTDYEFRLDTTEAGPGNVKIRVGGPSGAFKVQTRKDGPNVLRCRYNPQCPGLYVVHVYWSGDHVPGSPFNVFFARDQLELSQYLSRTSVA